MYGFRSVTIWEYTLGSRAPLTRTAISTVKAKESEIYIPNCVKLPLLKVSFYTMRNELSERLVHRYLNPSHQN